MFFRAVMAAMVGAAGFAAPAAADQLVYLDFDSTSADILPAHVHTYTPAERAGIKAYLEDLYTPYGVTFTLAAPPPFTASTIKFNHGSLGGGYGDQIDFRNVDASDDCFINAVGGLAFYDGTPNPFGLPGELWTPSTLYTSANIELASANFAAHELGHILGLRHHDSFGPIGGGVGVSPSSYTPAYPGPTSAHTTSFHIMSLSSSVALNSGTLLTPKWLSQRSAIKLEFARSGLTVPEGGGFHGAIPMAMPLTLMPMTIANPLKLPEFDPTFSPSFLASAVAVTASVGIGGGAGESDYYSFMGSAGQRLTIEVISAAMGPDLGGRIADPANPFVALLDSVGALLPYAGLGTTLNDNESETTDSILFDVFLPYTGTYYVEVGTGFITGTLDGGSYELFIYSTRAIPAPGGLGVLALAGLITMRRRRVE